MSNRFKSGEVARLLRLGIVLLAASCANAGGGDGTGTGGGRCPVRAAPPPVGPSERGARRRPAARRRPGGAGRRGGDGDGRYDGDGRHDGDRRRGRHRRPLLDGRNHRDGGRDGHRRFGRGDRRGGRQRRVGASGGAGGATTSACGVVPVDPNATPQAKKLLCYLYIYGKNVLSGQQETSWSNPAGDMSFYTSSIGKAPAILGGDFLYGGPEPGHYTSRAQAYWAAGGISMIRYHMGAPPNSDSYANSMLAFSSAQCDNVVTVQHQRE